MNDPNAPPMQIDHLEQQYERQQVSNTRLLELLTSSAFHKKASRGPSLSFHHDLVLALLELKRRRNLAALEAAQRRHDERTSAISPPDEEVVDPLEQAARDLLSLVQNKDRPMSHPDNVRLTDAGDTILVNEVRLLLLQVALPRHRAAVSSAEPDRAQSSGAGPSLAGNENDSRQSVRDVYTDALFAQSASNLGALVHGFEQVITQLQNEAGAVGHGTDWINTHPACVLFAEQIYFLSGNGRNYASAYRECTEKARPDSAQG